MLVERQSGQNPMRSRRKDVGSLLLDQIRALAGPGHVVKMIRERRWASITFSGTRHSVAISHQVKAVADDELLSLAEAIADHEFDLPGHFVADALVDDRPRQGDSITVEILTIIDPVAV